MQGCSPRLARPQGPARPMPPLHRTHQQREPPHPAEPPPRHAHQGRVQHPLLEVGAGSVVLVHRPPQRLARLPRLELCLREPAPAVSPGARGPPRGTRRRGAGDKGGVSPCRSPSGWCPPSAAARTPGTCCGSSPWTWAAAGPPRAAAGRPRASPTPPPWTGHRGQGTARGGQGGCPGCGGGGRGGGGGTFLCTRPCSSP